MLMVMEMATGTLIEDGFDAEFGEFKDEVLNAEWLPPSPELQAGLQDVHAPSATGVELDAEAFLDTVYRNQR